MSNLGLKMVQMLVPSEKQDIKCPYTMTAEYITIHNTANNASALAEISYMVGNGNEVSYHWAVDDVQAIQAIPHNRNAWHCGDGGSGNGNRKSIGIEICYSLTPGHPNYAKSEDNGAKLTAIILHQMGWGVDRIRKHQDWSGKYCPHRILDNGNWVGFKQKVQSYLDQLKNGAQAPEEKKVEEQDMFTISAPGRGIALVAGGTFYALLDAKDPVAFWDKGVPHMQISQATFDNFQHKSNLDRLDDETVNKLIKGLK
ncbi:N-acetylmuramoyl-L-alanine amidase family protein [Streptococcus suis]|uniref:N-acetylmuramoyl-L-alanine amidase n=3 Tax=Streptococcus suis TaxID=1307 RepID=A0A9X4MPK8_STRSU|nr:N-acetylmuramoyl-L-alanine amidase [Streptococcus suis]MBY5024602.1 N-acetylmuramoyl-L-alanine amidase [Streptococcus suis]MDG4525862.1 N-acetylmuramoyl-L-alanine amidase [Streptococcus suis]MDG4528248.1 N-acetylmuramoyl-L-alanine amidase [Streptococcus suis]QZT17250.1 N-acetylmuramoyl-L-alanine amidase [Streptococcus suis]HEP1800174.1 N-acetylmuramoyl-L-alanine amidase [Streptococcus suis]